jgi:hypothetical protein
MGWFYTIDNTVVLKKLIISIINIIIGGWKRFLWFLCLVSYKSLSTSNAFTLFIPCFISSSPLRQ